ncbi:MAG: hypothetical protein IKP19_08150 [Oscillospiraceae bacterium]|nr:hypothetical protein [Oscillospiraceae bacterium]
MKNPAKLLRLKRMWDGFATRHPKLLRYLAYISDNSLEEGAILDITVTNSQGKSLHSNARLTAEDVQFLKEIRAVLGSGEL